ncbi:MAG: diacylglycerol kinase family lipid kinase, partial [Streptococcaceae bacterium]|nr:diacylglycerol kinase family lipid kinase [Streptococcaceae bacterium]
EQAFLFTVTKHPFFGGGIQIAPNASNMRDELTVIELDKPTLKTIRQLLPRVIKATHLEDPRFHVHTDTTFTLEIDLEQPMQIDGEVFHLPANMPLTITTEKRQIIN